MVYTRQYFSNICTLVRVKMEDVTVIAHGHYQDSSSYNVLLGGDRTGEAQIIHFY